MLEALLLGKSTSRTQGMFLAGTMDHGWFGEVAAADFITGDALASAVGLTAGMSQHSDAGWLKFALDGKVLYVAKRPFRHSVSWLQLNGQNLVLGTRWIIVSNKTYKIRLLKGRGDNSDTAISAGYDIPQTHGSEWNRLMYHVSGKPFRNGLTRLASENLIEGDWEKYQESNLITDLNYGNGAYCWCQESAGGFKIGRGYDGVSGIYPNPGDAISKNAGWRPCLELVP